MRTIDAEKYMELLKEQYLHHKSMGDSQAARAWQGAMQLLYDMPTLTPPNEWVSVDERLPEPDFPGQQRGFYLVALSNGTVKELMYEFRHYENMMFDVGWHETAYPVTHWMPLPAPPDRRPQEGEEGDANRG